MEKPHTRQRILDAAVRAALEHDPKVLVEAAVHGEASGVVVVARDHHHRHAVLAHDGLHHLIPQLQRTERGDLRVEDVAGHHDRVRSGVGDERDERREQLPLHVVERVVVETLAEMPVSGVDEPQLRPPSRRGYPRPATASVEPLPTA